jgi:hypothetical protein
MIPPFGILAPGRILFGRGRAAKAPGLIAAIGRRIVLVHGKNAERAEWLIVGLRAEGAEVLALACPGEPDLPLLETALAEVRAFRAEAFVSLGGGAAIDLGKALAALAPGKGAPLDHLEVVGKGLPLTAPPLPFAALPTTSGTGAEATKNAVIGIPSERRKVSLRDDRMLPRLALIDPALTDGCPRAVTLASGLDALTQVIEPYLSTRANPFTDALCRAAIPAALAALPKLMESEAPEARDAMAWASLTGGLALANAGLGAVHGLAGVIGGLTGAAHGAICGALLPHVLRLHAEELPPLSPGGQRIAELAGLFSARLGAKDGFGALEIWAREAGLPRLSALGLRPEDRAQAAEAAQGASSMKADPARPSAERLARLLADAG